MKAIGFRAEPAAVSFAVLEGSNDKPVLLGYRGDQELRERYQEVRTFVRKPKPMPHHHHELRT